MRRFLWADESDFPQIAALWHQGFPEDSEEDILTFWRSMRNAARCLLLKKGEQVLSMAFVLPTFLHEEKKRTLWYVYAAVTDTAFRGQGLFSSLLDHLADKASENGVYGLFLRPATPSLFSYYAACGFTTAFYVKEYDYKAKPLYTTNEPIVWQRIDANYGVYRNEWLSRIGVPFVEWTKEETAYALSLLRNGGALVSKHGALLYEQERDCVTITELLCLPQEEERVLQSLTRVFTCRKMLVRTPSQTKENATAFGMLRCVDGDTPVSLGYMGFTLE